MMMWKKIFISLPSVEYMCQFSTIRIILKIIINLW
jgi:hypothetical protein